MLKIVALNLRKLLDLCITKTKTVMKTIKSNIWNLQVGDVISFTNYANSFRVIEVGRVEEKSWYCVNGARSSYGTLASYQKSFPDFTITRP